MTHDLDKVRLIMNEFTSFHHKATANMIAVFCYIAARNDQVLETRDLPAAMNLPQTTINRLVRTMAERSYARDEGFQLLKQTLNPIDERQRFVELTPKGKILAQRLKEIING
jgi:DNA-binding MarR family transcriptional regulator